MNLCIRTDSEEATVIIYDESSHKVAAVHKWLAGRQLSSQIHNVIQSTMKQASVDYADIKGVVVYAGPGSFTGLRIGFSVANAVASGLDLPIISARSEEWYSEHPTDHSPITPFYGSEPNITTQKK
jgi:tRNA threonylcarbamoyladenosine biosynthesis protein TsaB